MSNIKKSSMSIEVQFRGILRIESRWAGSIDGFAHFILQKITTLYKKFLAQQISVSLTINHKSTYKSERMLPLKCFTFVRKSRPCKLHFVIFVYIFRSVYSHKTPQAGNLKFLSCLNEGYITLHYITFIKLRFVH